MLQDIQNENIEAIEPRQPEPGEERAPEAENTQPEKENGAGEKPVDRKRQRWGMLGEISNRVNLLPTIQPGKDKFYTDAESNMLWKKYQKILTGDGQFVKNCLNALYQTANFRNNQETYTLLPLNPVLWLYKIGSCMDESSMLYEGMAAGYRKFIKRSAEKLQERLIRRTDIPVTDNVMKMIASPNYFRSNARGRDFTKLMSLITAVSCAVSGGRMDADESDLMHEVLAKAAPSIFTRLSPLKTGERKYKYLYTAVWSPRNPWWNTSLFMLCNPNEAFLLLNALIARWEAYGKRRGTLEVGKLDRVKFFTLLCLQLEITTTRNPAETLTRSMVAGREAFW